MTTRERIAKLIKVWSKVYPDAHTELDFKTPLELLIATILSAQCTDKRVNMVTPALFKKYRSAKDYADSPPGELEEAIKSTGFFNSKAKSIRGAAAAIAEKFGGKVPNSMEELRELPGVGRKTANVVLGNAFGINEERRNRGGHARDSFVATSWPNEAERSGKDRAELDEACAAKLLGDLEPLADLARAPAMFRAQAGLREL